ncbi:hypothetical protein PAPYR_9370 [Paratrimastix pyriformis]|uniref:Uncharacterized protein n=1 Tax=Paratrimastix pyriformis TaxID=342808 RepID=A0ABQ8UA49_9EUKA|nr:hypothetical protein PAPYR_9370 [Paratrimastix pyriformis]
MPELARQMANDPEIFGTLFKLLRVRNAFQHSVLLLEELLPYATDMIEMASVHGNLRAHDDHADIFSPFLIRALTPFQMALTMILPRVHLVHHDMIFLFLCMAIFVRLLAGLMAEPDTVSQAEAIDVLSPSGAISIRPTAVERNLSLFGAGVWTQRLPDVICLASVFLNREFLHFLMSMEDVVIRIVRLLSTRNVPVYPLQFTMTAPRLEDLVPMLMSLSLAHLDTWDSLSQLEKIPSAMPNSPPPAYQTEVLYILTCLCSSRRKLEVQSLLLRNGIVPLLERVFNEVIDAKSDPAHVVLQLLRAMHGLLDCHSSNTLAPYFFTPDELMKELEHLFMFFIVGAARATRSFMMISSSAYFFHTLHTVPAPANHPEWCCKGHPTEGGLASRLLTRLQKCKEDTVRSWLGSVVEALHRDSTNTLQLYSIKKGLLNLQLRGVRAVMGAPYLLGVSINGAVDHLVDRPHGMREARGSIPLSSILRFFLPLRMSGPLPHVSDGVILGGMTAHGGRVEHLEMVPCGSCWLHRGTRACGGG